MLDVVVADGPPPTRGSGRSVNVWRDGDKPFAEADACDDGYRLEWRGIGILSFSPGSTRVRLWPAAGVDAGAATAAVRQVVQPVILQAIGYQALHASAVRIAAGVVAFCGASGAGKSTIGFALGQLPGVTQIADDALVLEVSHHGILTHPLPFRPRLRPASRRFLPDPATTGPLGLVDRTASPLLAVFIITQSESGRTMELARVGPTRAFRALLTHAHCFDEGNRTAVASMVQAYLTAADAVPVFALNYRRDFAHLRAVQACILEAVDAGSLAPNHA